MSSVTDAAGQRSQKLNARESDNLVFSELYARVNQMDRADAARALLSPCVCRHAGERSRCL